MKNLAILTLALACATLAPSANSQIVKCKAASGQLVYTEKNCPPGTEPLELSGSLPKSAHGSPASAGEPRSLSARARELEELVFACVHSANTECNEYQHLYRYCRDKRNRGTPDCRALVELLLLVEREGIEEKMLIQSEVCREHAAGEPEKCGRMFCSMAAVLEPDDQQLRYCARLYGFPSTSSWVLVYEAREPAGNWSGDYACFPRYRVLGPVGEPTWQRGQIFVEARMKDGRPTGPFMLMGREQYPSAAAAADAGCARNNAWLAEQQKRDAAAPGGR